MQNLKKYTKYISLALIFVFCVMLFASINAATISSNGSPIQYGWYSTAPKTQQEANNATYGVFYYPATINGNQAFCMDWAKKFPSSGTSLSQAGTLPANITKVIYEGLKGGYSKPAIQLAVFLQAGDTSSSMPSMYSRIVSGKYGKSSASLISASQLSSYKSEVNSIVNAARNSTAKIGSSSGNVSISVSKASGYDVKKSGDYYYEGPVNVSSNSGNPITVKLSNSTFGLVPSVGATTNITKISGSGTTQVYLKFPANYTASNSCTATFYTNTSTVVNGYIYSTGNSSYQRFAVITYDSSSTSETFTFSWKFQYKLRVIKKDANTGKVLSGATFELYNSAGTKVDTKVSDANGEVLFTKLDAGTYTVKEVAAPSGYNITTQSQRVTLGGEPSTVKVIEFKDEETKRSVIVYKRDAANSMPLSGAIIELYNSNKVYMREATTGSDGTVTFSNLDPGVYYVREKQAPPGYIITDTSYVQVDVRSKSSTATFYDKKPQGRISIAKYMQSRTNKQAVGSGEATFGIFKSSTATQVGQISTDGRGIATSGNLDVGSYYLQESTVNNNIMKINTEKVYFNITETDTPERIINLGEFINEARMGDIEIYKYYLENGTKQPLMGAKFQIYDSAGGIVATVTTNVKGKAYVEDLDDGVYSYREIEVPDGYILDSSVRTFNISRTNKHIYVEVENKVKYGTLNIIKISNDGKEVPLKDVVFNVLASNKSTVVATIKTDANGKASAQLKYGTYYLREVSAPKTVILKNTDQRVVIGETAGAKIVYDLTIKNDIISKGIKLYKVDNENMPISGVRFALYSDAEGQNQVATATTDVNGLAVFNNLEVGTYYYKELAAPDGFITTKISEMKPIKINDSNPLYEETIVNSPIMGQVKVHKIDEEGNTVAGAEFDIKDSNGKVVAHIVTDKNGVATSPKLRKGNYTLVETKVPTGYIILKEPTAFTINTNNEIVEKEIVNKFNRGKVKIKKVDADTKEFIDGAVFEIYQVQKDGKGKLVDTIRKYSKEGVGTSQELKNGKYYLIETVAPYGALIDNTKYEFEVTDTEKEFSFTIENKVRKGKIALIKNDNYGEPAPYVEFQILAENKTTIVETLKTDEKGLATSKALVVGKYYVKESSAPAQYIPVDKLIECNITEDGQIITLKDEIVNKRVPVGKIALVKTSDAGNVIEGAKFQILASDKKTVIEELVTDKEGKATSKDMRTGTYYVRETWAPEIYQPISDLIKVEIKEDKQVITLQNEIVNKKITGGIKIIKKNDAGTPVEGVKFAVYKEGSTNPVTTVTTNSQGVALVNDLLLGKYYFVETYVPDTIYIKTEQVPFEVTYVGELVERTVTNERVKGKLIINKINSENGTPIEGVTFKVYDSNKNALGLITTNLDGIATTDDLKDANGNVIPLYSGTYYYAEISAPSRFFFDDTMHPFAIAKGAETVTVNVENTPFKLPQTGGFLSTDATIILIVSIVSIAGYIFGNIMINRRRFW